MHLSLIIPAYNEEKRIGDTLRRVVEYLAEQSFDSEILLVDDGSQDKTREVVEREFPEVRIISYAENRGKGHAVRTGMLEGKGDIRFFFDADGSTPIEDLAKFWPFFDAGAAVVIGSRALPESRIDVHQPWYRESMGRVFNLFLRLFRLTRFPDTQCGCKGFTAEACRVVFPRQTIERWCFDAELLHIAHKHGLRIEQVPVSWAHVGQSRVQLFSGSARMLLDLIMIRLKDLAGKYA